MGTHYYVCSNRECGESFPDSMESTVWCEGCDCVWCCEECAQQDGYSEEPWFNGEEMWYQSCGYCRGENIDDETAFKYALKLLGLTREELVQKWRERDE